VSSVCPALRKPDWEADLFRRRIEVDEIVVRCVRRAVVVHGSALALDSEGIRVRSHSDPGADRERNIRVGGVAADIETNLTRWEGTVDRALVGQRVRRRAGLVDALWIFEALTIGEEIVALLVDVRSGSTKRCETGSGTTRTTS